MRFRRNKALLRCAVICLGLLMASWTAVPLQAQQGPTCTPIEPDELRELTFTGLHKLLYAELEEARILLSHATRQQTCLTAVVPPQLMSHAWLGLAGVRLQQGDEDGARAAVTRAILINPDARWSPQLGTRGATLLSQEQARLQAQTRARWRLPLLKPGQDVYVDGLRWLHPERARHWAPGPHLVQVMEADRVVYADWVNPREL